VGLDITAYSRLKHLGQHEPDNSDEGCEYDPKTYDRVHIQAYAYDDFPQSFRGIPVLGTEASNSGHIFLEGGCYELTAETETHAFRAGSYGGYNRWRADLARQFNPGPPHAENGPFFELVWFADNEGSIGPEAAKDLLEDFRAYEDRYAPDVADAWWRDGYVARYRDWMRAFELAADGGLVDFH